MEIDELLEFMKKRRSIRRFKSDAVPDEHIEKMLEAGRWAMSGANTQPAYSREDQFTYNVQ